MGFKPIAIFLPLFSNLSLRGTKQFLRARRIILLTYRVAIASYLAMTFFIKLLTPSLFFLLNATIFV